MDKRCDCKAVTAKLYPARSGASPALEFISHHASATADIALGHRTRGGVVQDGERMGFGDGVKRTRRSVKRDTNIPGREVWSCLTPIFLYAGIDRWLN